MQLSASGAQGAVGRGSGDDVSHVRQEFIHDDAISIAGDMHTVTPANIDGAAIWPADAVHVITAGISQECTRVDITEFVALAEIVHEHVNLGKLSIEGLFFHDGWAHEDELSSVSATEGCYLHEFLCVNAHPCL